MSSIRITEVHTGHEEERLLLQVLRSGHLAQGPMVERLEAQFSSIVGARHAIAVNSGTTALVATLQALSLAPGDEVITSPFTFVATLNAIIEAGAVARFADIGPDFNIDAGAIEALVGPRTRVIMPVHLYGLPADMDGIMAIAARHGLAVVEDAAQAIGASIAGRQVGSFGHGCFSLYATKNVTSGEGGVITTNDEAVADHLRVLRNQGMRGRYDYVVPGHNYRMTDLHAAIAVAQLGRLDIVTAARQRNASALASGLESIQGIVVPASVPSRSHVFHQFTVQVLPDARMSRDQLARSLSDVDIQTGIYYPKVVYDYPVFLNHPLVRLDETPAARTSAATVLSLPVHPALSEGDIDRIIDSIDGLLGSR